MLYASIFGTIDNPLSGKFGIGSYKDVTTGLPLLISNVVRLVTIAGGIWMFGNLLVAGFMYLTAGGETEKVNKAWAMIYQSMIGLVVIVGAFAITGVISLLLYGSVTAILQPTIFGPGTP